MDLNFREDVTEQVNKYCDTNNLVINNLKRTSITPIIISEDNTIDNLFDLLKYNTGKVKMVDDPNTIISAPKYKFIIDNASRLTYNINGINLFENIQKPLRENCGDFFGIYQNINLGVFCPGSSIMDAMDNCSMKYNSTEPKEFGTTNFELSHKGTNNYSYGGTVLYYQDDTRYQTNVNIDFRLQINEDIAIINTNNINVSDADNLKARIVYKTVIQTIKQLFLKNYGISMEDFSNFKSVYSDENNAKKWLSEKMQKMWSMLQFKQHKENFNVLIGSTAIKNMGDFLQECQGTLQWGGYINAFDDMVDTTNDFIISKMATPITRCVTKSHNIIPYDEKGNALRLCVHGDRPSGFRSIYILMNALTGINEHSIAGYLMKEKSLLVTKDGIIYVDSNPKNVKLDRFSIQLDIKEKKIKKEKEVDKDTSLIPNLNEQIIKEKGGKLHKSMKRELFNKVKKHNSIKKYKRTNKKTNKKKIIKVKKNTIKKQ